ncbi:peptidase inhibitor family I36 protein [Streptomyces sp. NPDC051362]|uniref:peptidase inhibitor family I36 protein n=1 Tax=Streptomyces sp. NPDC051362 TaxID=3365651 RepID=UPI0037B4FB7C
MKKKAFGVLTFAALALSLGTTMAPQASAAPAAYTCASGQLCVYENANYTGSVYIVKDDLSDFNSAALHYTNGNPLQDSISSVINNTGQCVEFSTDSGFGGSHQYYTRYSRTAAVAYNDEFSSVDRYNC